MPPSWADGHSIAWGRLPGQHLCARRHVGNDRIMARSVAVDFSLIIGPIIGKISTKRAKQAEIACAPQKCRPPPCNAQVFDATLWSAILGTVSWPYGMIL